jgi:hypothetical protein
LQGINFLEVFWRRALGAPGDADMRQHASRARNFRPSYLGAHESPMGPTHTVLLVDECSIYRAWIRPGGRRMGGFRIFGTQGVLGPFPCVKAAYYFKCVPN